MKTETRPLKQEAWLKCKDSLTQIVKVLHNGYRRVNQEQVFPFKNTELKGRQEKDLTNAPNVTKGFTLHDDEAEFSIPPPHKKKNFSKTKVIPITQLEMSLLKM